MIEMETEICSCGKPLVQQPGSRQKRRYCNDACKQAAYRKRAEQKAREQVISVQAMARIDELEQELSRYKQIVNLDNRSDLVETMMLWGERLSYRGHNIFSYRFPR